MGSLGGVDPETEVAESTVAPASASRSRVRANDPGERRGTAASLSSGSSQVAAALKGEVHDVPDR